MADLVITCRACGKQSAISDIVGRRDACEHCRADLRCCKNCQYYDTTAHHECREPTAEWVADKERGNFCGMFRPFTGGRAAADDVASAKAKLEALFKKT